MMKYSQLGARGALAAFGLAVAASAQNTATIHTELSAFRSQAGNDWELLADPETGYARMLFGGNAKPAFVPISDADYFLVARAHLGAAQGMFRVAPTTLQENAVNFMPLGLVGSSDKVGVEFRQAINGVPVRGGWLNTLLDMEGRLLAIDNTGLPQTAGINTTPTRSLEQAMAFAMLRFVDQTGLPGSFVGPQELVVEQELINGERSGKLAWNLVITSPEDDSVPESFRYLISADAELRVITQENMIHHAASPDVGGTVFGRVTPGIGPDVGVYQNVPLPNIRVRGPGGVTYTDANGNFNYPGVNGSLKCIFEMTGPYAKIDTVTGVDVVNVSTLTGTGNSVVINKNPAEKSTSQLNGFLHVNLMREWTRAINPSDATMDFQSLTKVNALSSCNAFYTGFATTYYIAGGSCPNMAYSSVIYHEMGHWQNDRYNSGNGADGFGEGNADVFATYQTNDPIVGRGFFGNFNSGIRTGTNTRQFCGDSNGGCYGQVHADGEVLLGALWKVRANLQATHGNILGGDLANALHNGWMNGYNQSAIRSVIETQWLILDDNNGTLSDGTPNFDDINDAFLAQGFPGRNPATTPGSTTLYGQFLGGSNIGVITSNSYPSSNSDLVIDVAGFVNSPTAMVAISATQLNTPGFGGTLLTAIGQAFVLAPVNLVSGIGQTVVSIPPGVDGFVGYAQAFAADGTQSEGFALSSGMIIQVAD